MSDLHEFLKAVCEDAGVQGNTRIPVASNGFDLLLGLSGNGNYAYLIDYHDEDSESELVHDKSIETLASSLLEDLQEALSESDYPTGDPEFDAAWQEATRNDDGFWNEDDVENWLVSELQQVLP